MKPVLTSLAIQFARTTTWREVAAGLPFAVIGSSLMLLACTAPTIRPPISTVSASTANVVPATEIFPAQGATDKSGHPATNDWPPAVGPVRQSRCSGPLQGKGRTINVGPGQTHAELTTVPWLSLAAGDVVNIFHREQPYRTKFGLRAQGSAQLPVIINGVTGSQCQLPHISGERAITAQDAIAEQFFEEEWETGSLALIFLYRLKSDKYGFRPKHITFQNLKLSGANQRNQYLGETGKTKKYHRAAAAIYGVVGEHITIDNCEISRNGNGVFFNTKSKEETSSNITIRNSRIFDNGNPGSHHEHNLYIQVRRAVYEGNYIGQLVAGARGSSLKDRSSATVVRFNHIDAAARAIDLVEIEGGYVVDDPLYPFAWVYGNLIISDHSREPMSSTLLIHWGGDNDPRYFRNGTLFFYNNTVVTKAQKRQHYYLSLFQLADNQHKVDVRFNVLINSGTAEQYLAYDAGQIELAQTNWITSGWGKGVQGVELTQVGELMSGGLPSVDATYRPKSGSVLLDRAGGLRLPVIATATMQNLTVDFEYSEALGLVHRKTSGRAADLGAFEGREPGARSP